MWWWWWRQDTKHLQVALTRAADFWRTVPIPAKNIAQLKTTDGPNGARGAIFKAGTKVLPLPPPPGGLPNSH